MIQITGETADEIFVQVAQHILYNGIIINPRGLETKEICDVYITLLNPKKSIVTLPERNINMVYLEGEKKWYESGSLDAKDIAIHSSFWNTIANDDGKVNSNYGYIVYHQKCPNGKSQFEWCVEKMQSDLNTRQAIIMYNQLEHKYNDNKDFVCTVSQLFRNHNGVVDCMVYMRSNDLIYGLTYDMPWFTSVHEKFCEHVGLQLGTYHQFVSSLHIYKKHYDMVKRIANPSNTHLTLLNQKLKKIHLLQTFLANQSLPINEPHLFGDDCIGWEHDVEINEYRFYIYLLLNDQSSIQIYGKNDGQFYTFSFDFKKNASQIKKISILEMCVITPEEDINKCLQIYQNNN